MQKEWTFPSSESPGMEKFMPRVLQWTYFRRDNPVSEEQFSENKFAPKTSWVSFWKLMLKLKVPSWFKLDIYSWQQEKEKTGIIFLCTLWNKQQIKLKQFLTSHSIKVCLLLPLKDTPASGDHHACCNQVPTGSVQISIPSLLAILALLSFHLC